MHDIQSGNTPDYLSSLFPPTIDDATPYYLRNPNDLVTINRRTELFAKSFVPSAISLWNSLPDDLKQIESFSQFKTALCNSLFKQDSHPSYYMLGERRYCVLHARIRNNCSDLNFDLFRNHLQNHSCCECGHEREDAEHYLLKCQQFVDARLKLFHKTRPYHP